MFAQWHKLDHDTYIKTKRIIRQYPYLIAEYDSIIHASPSHDGQPRGTGISDPTGRTTLKLMDVSFKIDAIHKSLDKIPQGYQKGIFGHIVYHQPFPPYAGESTWRRWQYRFVFYVKEALDDYARYK